MGALLHVFGTEGFPPRWTCGDAWAAEPALGWAHIASDIAIWAAYLAIPIALFTLARKRRDFAFPGVLWLFGAFIVSCGAVHLVEAIIFWHPVYRLSAVLKIGTALVSGATAVTVIRLLPTALDLPRLAQDHERLTTELHARQASEKDLRERNVELEDFTEAVLNREDRIQELKSEVNALLQQLGQDARYRTDVV